jgi:hypothetical protein
MIKNICIMPKESTNITKLFYCERKGQTFIKKLSKVKQKSNQIFREINID